MQLKQRTGCAVVCAVVAAVGVSACGGGDSGAGAQAGGSGKTIVVGTFGPRTGAGAASFPAVESADACFKAIDAAGGVNGYKFAYKIRDDQADPSLTVNAARALVTQDKIFAAVATNATAPNLAAKPYFAAQKVPVIAMTGSSQVAGPMSYITLQSSTTDGAFQTKYAIQGLKAHKLGLLYQNDDIGNPVRQGVEYEAKQLGQGKPVEVAFQIDTSDLSPLIGRLKAAGVDVVVFSGSSQNLPKAIQAASSINYNPKWLASAFIASTALLKQFPQDEAKNIYLASAQTLPDSQDAASMRAALKKYHPAVPPSGLTVTGWVPCSLFKEAFAKMTANGGKPTREGLVKALDGLSNFSNGYVQGLTYAPKPGVQSPHVPRPDELVARWDGSGLKVVSPYSAAPKVSGTPGQ